jgi:hypothetical protein
MSVETQPEKNRTVNGNKHNQTGRIQGQTLNFMGNNTSEFSAAINIFV